jgi:hypothetical protein
MEKQVVVWPQAFADDVADAEAVTLRLEQRIKHIREEKLEGADDDDATRALNGIRQAKEYLMTSAEYLRLLQRTVGVVIHEIDLYNIGYNRYAVPILGSKTIFHVWAKSRDDVRTFVDERSTRFGGKAGMIIESMSQSLELSDVIAYL